MPEELKEIILSEIEREGRITFARYIELCLYDPQYGYYMKPGPRRDYYTSPQVHPLFGAMLAKQIAQFWRLMGEGDLTVVEVGGGEGQLASAILQYLRGREPELYEGMLYLMVERSPYMISLQRRRLKGEDKVKWCEWEELDGVRGVFLSNELIDSFPVHRVIKAEEGLQEIYVAAEDGELVEVLGPPTPEVKGYFRWLGLLPPPGHKAEINLKALDWMEDVARKLAEGFVITIDYGYPAEELFFRFPSGSLLSYRGGGVSPDLYVMPGDQDLTAHVNFTALMKKGEEEGLRTLGFTTQGRFLLALGILEEASSLGERLAAKHLILPGGMGDTFRVLIQAKRIEVKEGLLGFGDPFRRG